MAKPTKEIEAKEFETEVCPKCKNPTIKVEGSCISQVGMCSSCVVDTGESLVSLKEKAAPKAGRLRATLSNLNKRKTPLVKKMVKRRGLKLVEIKLATATDADLSGMPLIRKVANGQKAKTKRSHR